MTSWLLALSPRQVSLGDDDSVRFKNILFASPDGPFCIFSDPRLLCNHLNLRRSSAGQWVFFVLRKEVWVKVWGYLPNFCQYRHLVCCITCYQATEMREIVAAGLKCRCHLVNRLKAARVRTVSRSCTRQVGGGRSRAVSSSSSSSSSERAEPTD